MLAQNKKKKLNANGSANKKAANLADKGKKRQRSNTKDQTTKKRKVQVEDNVEYEDLGNMDTWDWSEVAVPAGVTMGDEASGFLCLEEIDDVQIDYIGDEKTGKVATFKRIKKSNRKTGKKATPEEPLDIEMMDDYYDLDTFDEELAKQDKEGSEEPDGQDEQDGKDEQDEENEQDEQDMEDGEGETNADDNEAMDVDTNAEPSDAAEKQPPVDDGPKKSKKLTKQQQKLEKLKAQVKALEDSIKASTEEEKPKEAAKSKRPTVEDVDQEFDITAWGKVLLSEPIRNALKYHKFSQPTPIQKKTLPLALKGRDIIGAAETGSGKTLAFGIPIVDYIIRQETPADGLTGLILTPTRELAIQVKNHIQNIAVFTNIKIAAIVGGMSVQKQHRLLKNKPDIIVATPGRLWELFSENGTYMDMLKNVKFLVLDEADRMLEKGRYEELNNMLDILSKKRTDTTDWPEESEEAKTIKKPQNESTHQTFVFTATLGKELRFNIRQRKFKKDSSPMEMLIQRLELENKDPAIIDITPEDAVASRLVESKIECLKTDKDLYVYYFVTRYPGRTIVFVNSIDAIRRLIPVFKLLGVEVLGLHAQMQQKQRLKNLDRFKANDKAVLIASDVAARGLDIPLVEHVIHYQLPRSGEIYVHRSGRTARANRDGVSLLLCAPDEMKLYTKLCQTLRKGNDYPNLPVDVSILREMKKRVALATEIDKLEHQNQKAAHDDNWMRRMAKEMDIEFDEDVHGTSKSTTIDKGQIKKIQNKKAQLQQLLKKPMLPDGVSPKYLTSGIISDLPSRIIENSNSDNAKLPAHLQSKAVQDITAKQAKQPKHAK